MLHYLRKYPFSLIVIGIILYLSFFRPPSTELDTIEGIDKVVHICMYGGLSGILWLEFLRTHLDVCKWLKGWIGAVICPILLSGLIEILQSSCTDYRGGDILDFAANVLGVALATLFAWFILKPYFLKKRSTDVPEA